ncbi:MAG: glycoside hydrolase family 2 TIM barrel-domain containing protein [Psychroserpens sp.]|uniref:glycoside hydrolase family 2 TIM barrel-domain containing protein n=1 Tax=Psychroserpens sp. TaxID=2020870 RepID=UPI003C87146C
MKYRFILPILYDLLLFMFFGLILMLFPWGGINGIYNSDGVVHINSEGDALQLYRNGKPFYIKGASGDSYFGELSNMGANTIRVYDTLNLASVLDNADKNGLAVIVDIPLPEYDEKYSEYDDDTKNEARKTKIKSLVRTFKNYPALLIWNLGNEVRYPITLIPNKFIKTYNDLIDIIHEEDPNHLVGTTVQRRMDIMAISRHSSKLDIIGYNIFGTIGNLKSNIESLNSILEKPFPYYISEWGIDGYWETEQTTWGASIEPTSTKKIEQLRYRYNNFIRNAGDDCQGSLIFYWGQKHECTNTWFNAYGQLGEKSIMISMLEMLWANKEGNSSKIGLDYMLLDERGAQNSIVLNPNSLIKAELKLKETYDDSLKIRWELYHDHCSLESISDDIGNPKKVENLLTPEHGLSTMLKTPLKEGPYRIYAYLENKDGLVGTCNTPFYVLDSKNEQ